jgi:periplasmic divalent cation tolerance protein
MVYVTCRNRAEAQRLARLALEKRLAGCANIFPVTSLYWWKGAIAGSREAAIILKTRASLVRPLIAELKKAHSYEVPCIDVLPIVDMNPDCAAWLASGTGRSARRAGRKRQS